MDNSGFLSKYFIWLKNGFIIRIVYRTGFSFFEGLVVV